MPGAKQNKIAFGIAVFIFQLISLFSTLVYAQQLNNTVSKAAEAKLEKQMIDYLEAMRLRLNNPDNSFAAEAKIKYLEGLSEQLTEIGNNISERLDLGESGNINVTGENWQLFDFNHPILMIFKSMYY